MKIEEVLKILETYHPHKEIYKIIYYKNIGIYEPAFRYHCKSKYDKPTMPGAYVWNEIKYDMEWFYLDEMIEYEGIIQIYLIQHDKNGVVIRLEEEDTDD